MRAILIIGGAALALAACSANNQANSDMNAMVTDNMTMDENAAMNAGGMDANLATNAATENAMMNDLTHNDADTNLANGM